MPVCMNSGCVNANPTVFFTSFGIIWNEMITDQLSLVVFLFFKYTVTSFLLYF